MKELTLRILGKPVPKQSFRYTKSGGKYPNPEAREEQRNVRAQIVSQLPEGFVPFSGPVEVNIIYTFPAPQNTKKMLKELVESGRGYIKHKAPDCENLLKLTNDAMEGVVFLNDAQVFHVSITKKYVKTPGVIILVIAYEDIEEAVKFSRYS